MKTCDAFASCGLLVLVTASMATHFRTALICALIGLVACTLSEQHDWDADTPEDGVSAQRSAFKNMTGANTSDASANKYRVAAGDTPEVSVDPTQSEAAAPSVDARPPVNIIPSPPKTPVVDMEGELARRMEWYKQTRNPDDSHRKRVLDIMYKEHTEHNSRDPWTVKHHDDCRAIRGSRKSYYEDFS